MREDQNRRAEERLDALLLEGLDIGQPIEVDEEYIQRKRAELLARVERSRKDAG